MTSKITKWSELKKATLGDDQERLARVAARTAELQKELEERELLVALVKERKIAGWALAHRWRIPTLRAKLLNKAR